MFADGHNLGMRTVRRNSVAGLEVLDATATGQDHSGRAVTHRHGRIESLAHLSNGVEQALVAALLDDPPNQIGPLAGLAEQRFLSQIDHHPLSPGGDDRGDVSDQHFAGLHNGAGISRTRSFPLLIS